MKLPDQILVGFGTEISLHPVLSRCHSFFLFLFFSFLFVTFFLTETTHAQQETNLDKQVSSSLQEIILIKNPFSWDLYSAENLFHVLLKSNQTIQEVMLSFFVFLCIFYSFFQSLKNDPQVSLILSTASFHFGI